MPNTDGIWSDDKRHRRAHRLGLDFTRSGTPECPKGHWWTYTGGAVSHIPDELGVRIGQRRAKAQHGLARHFFHQQLVWLKRERYALQSGNDEIGGSRRHVASGKTEGIR